MTDYPMTLFHDGACPVCRFEVANLKARNHAGMLHFIDITDPDFEPSRYGMSLREFDTAIRALCADGRMVAGVEVFRLAYRAVGLGWIVAPTNYGFFRRPADALYRVFARNRNRIGRHFGNMFDYLAARQAAGRTAQCKDGACSIDTMKKRV